MGRTQAMAVSLVLIAVLIGAGLGFSAAPSPEPVPALTLTTFGESRPALVVHVSGWVATPGVVEVAEGSIVADAVAAAGGALEGAVLESLNLASPVLDGDHIQIPGPGEVIAATGGGDEGDGRIALNRADAAALEELPGVGPVLAERIVAHREANGPYQEAEDLLEVSGIGEAKLASIRDLIVVP
jgi:competence protein ComEA